MAQPAKHSRTCGFRFARDSVPTLTTDLAIDDREQALGIRHFLLGTGKNIAIDHDDVGVFAWFQAALHLFFVMQIRVVDGVKSDRLFP